MGCIKLWLLCDATEYGSRIRTTGIIDGLMCLRGKAATTRTEYLHLNNHDLKISKSFFTNLTTHHMFQLRIHFKKSFCTLQQMHTYQHVRQVLSQYRVFMFSVEKYSYSFIANGSTICFIEYP